MVTAMTVFEIERLAAIGDRFVDREKRTSENYRYSQRSKECHARISEAVWDTAVAALVGDERHVAELIAETSVLCSSCHYDVRDASRHR